MSDSNGGSKHTQVFLGSAHEALEYVDLIAEWLEEADLKPVTWDEPGVFAPGSAFMQQLLALARSGIAGAAFLFTPDDLMASGDAKTRDNVILEYGAFAAALGEERAIAIQVGESKPPSDLEGIIHIDLNKKRRAKRQVADWARKLKAGGRGKMGQLVETYVDAALCTESTSMARAEILKHANDQTVIPGKYLYDSDVGADHWISLCSDQTYSYFHDGLRFWGEEAETVVQAIKEKVGSEFDFISLGPGDGQKDLEIIRAWTEEDLDVIYYPYDVSLGMIIQVVREIRNSGVPINLRAVLADFDNLSQMKTVFGARDSPNVISLLGNSLGNSSNELKFVRNLSSLMDAGDLLLLEVRLRGGDSGLSELDKPKAREFYFSPFKHYLALEFDDGKLKSRPTTRPLSKIKGAHSTEIYYEDFEFEGKPYSNTPLLCINQYDQEDFIKTIKRIGFECVLEKVDEERSFLVCLMRRTERKVLKRG